MIEQREDSVEPQIPAIPLQAASRYYWQGFDQVKFAQYADDLEEDHHDFEFNKRHKHKHNDDHDHDHDHEEQHLEGQNAKNSTAPKEVRVKEEQKVEAPKEVRVKEE